MKRTHDALYANEYKNAPIKESFVFLGDRLEGLRNKELVLGDIGCAAGLLPSYLASRFEKFSVMGYEYSEELLDIAKKQYPHISFHALDVCDEKAIPEASLDIITMSGVLSIFDDYERIIKNLYKWLRPNGRILIFGLFNPYDLDVFVKYKHSEEEISVDLESGWNIISQASIGKVLDNIGDVEHRFDRFEISIDIPKNQNDAVRSWTEKDSHGFRNIVNGLCLQQPQSLLVIDKK